jgi:nitroreductase
MDFDKIIKERRSIRNFKTTKKPNYKDVIAAIDAASKAPIAGNIYAIKYILIQDKEKIKALSVACQQDFIAHASFIVAVCSDKKNLEANYLERGRMYSRQQAGASIENFLLKITELGLASCWIGAFADDSVKRILKIPDEIDVEALLPVGFELGKSKQKTKPDLDRVLFFDEWKNKFMSPKKMPDASQV